MVLPRATCPGCGKTMGVRPTPDGRAIYPRHQATDLRGFCILSRCLVHSSEYEDTDELENR